MARSILVLVTLLALLCACKPDDEAAPAAPEPAPGDPVPPSLASLVPVPRPWPDGHRALVGVPGESKALVGLDGSIAPMGHTTPKPKDRVVRLFVEPLGAGTTFTMKPLEPGLPIPVLSATVDGVEVKATVFAAPVAGAPAVVAEVALAGEEGDVALALSLNAEPQGITLEDGTLVAGDLALLHVWSGGGVEAALDGARVDCTVHLGADGAGSVWLALPSGISPEELSLAGPLDGDALLAAARGEWAELFAAGARITLPDPWFEGAWRASVANLLLLRDRVEDLYVVKPGASSYNSFWIRDAAYIVRAFDVAGLPDEAEESLRVLWRHPLPSAVNAMGTWGSSIEQKDDGRWESPNDEWDGPGQALWGLVGHYRFTGDDAFLDTVYPAIRAGALWLKAARKQTMGTAFVGKPTFGLLPEGYGEALLKWGYVLYHDYWGVLGMREAARAAAAAGEDEDAGSFSGEADAFRDDVRAAAAAAYVEQEGGGVIPAAHGAPDSRIWGSLAAVWPCGVLEPDNQMITDTFEQMWGNREWDLYRFSDTPDKVWTYVTADWAQALLVRGEWQRATDLLEGYRAVASPVFGWWEEIFISSGKGTGDNPHGWAAANLILWVRALLVAEVDDHTLALLRGAPPELFVEGAPIRLERLPTELGLLRSLVVATSPGAMVVDVELVPRGGEPTLVLYRRGSVITKASCDVAATVDGDHMELTGSRAHCELTIAPAQ